MRHRRTLRAALLMFVATCLLMASVVPAQAIEGTAYTYTLSIDGTKFVPTMDAYLPAGTYLSEVGLRAPEDMFMDGRNLYIADSGNHRIVVYALDTGEIETFGDDALKQPTGVSIDAEGNVYVADYGAGQVVIFAPDRTVKSTLTRPVQPYYGSSPYKPQKVDLDRYGNLFVISEGTYEGILQFDRNGIFNGFFGANRTKGLSLVEWFQKIFYTEEQKARMTFRTPPNIVSLDVSDGGMVYSVTQNDRRNAVKKLNMAGVNIYQADSFFGMNDYVDVAVLPGGGFYAVSSGGIINEFSETGVPLLQFGGTAKATDRNGLSAVVSAIEIDEQGNLYVLDKERGVLQVWLPTEYAKLLHLADDSFKQGDYEASLAAWEWILRMNPMAYMSHLGYGKALFQLRRYEEAAEHFEVIRAREEYSDCFWEIRSAWMRGNMEGILTAILLFAAVCVALSLLGRRYGWRDKLHDRYHTLCDRRPLLRALTLDTAYFLRHPIDGVYYIKTGQRGSVGAATILYAAALAVYLICQELTSFVFGGGYMLNRDPLAIVLVAVVPAGLFLVGSYLISAINDGEGSFRTIYISFAYSLSVYVLCWPLLTALTHVFTLTEIFICNMLAVLICGYSVIMVFISIKEGHVYNLRKTTGNILLTVFFMVVAILAAIVLFILWRELFSFVSEVFEEVRYHVFS